MEKVEVIIIGAGVIGLAIAAELSKTHNDIVLLEKEVSFGQHTSSRNSEVIHAGIYYPKDYLKTKLCVEGNRLLYSYCQEKKIPHARIGKLIVALDENEIKELYDLLNRAVANGVKNLQWLTKEQVNQLEPSINSIAALFSPSTGIIDSHSFMKELEREAQVNGALISYHSEVTSIQKSPDGYVIEINKEDKLLAERVINAAGLFSDKIAALAGIDIAATHYQLHLCKGEYFSYSKPSFLKHLIYPVTEQDVKDLGIHAVLDLAGGLKFGPNAEYVENIDYQVNPQHKSLFYKAINTLFPQIKEEDLSPDQAGIRPKLQGEGEGFRDFIIKEESDIGFPGLINLIGVESPGLTACLAIARHTSKLID